ncbi:FAD-binding oxidoreductase [Tropicimonas sp. IMCC6043]|nr:FAD-dependent oxidoreductase [Tropicimonas sp. IMCC6043]RYH09166.1 FAD-binding oxidoreductase [Tropicimonas sp. IMCC6043]
MTSRADTGLWGVSTTEWVTTRPLDRDLDVNLVVIGGGYTGCSAALEAARSGASVALLEAKFIGHGGSGRNVGLVNAGLWLPPDAILRQMGESAGMRLLEDLGKGPEAVFRIIEREAIECEPVRAGTLHLAHSAAGRADLEDRYRQGNRIGAPLRLLDADETARRTGTRRFHGALFDPRAGTIQPLAYCQGLARAAQAKGAHLFEASPADGVVRDGDRWRVSANGHDVRAAALLVATNAYPRFVTGLAQARFSVVTYGQFATEPLPDDMRAQILPDGEGCWDTAMVMSSFRVDRAGRLILGGMGSAGGPAGAIHGAWARRKLREVFPALAGVPFAHRWHGRIAMTADHIPKVLRIGPRACAVFGYSGRGIAPGTVFGTSAARALLNDQPDAFPIPVQDAYSERFTAARTAFFEFGAAVAHAVDPLR